MYIYIDMDHVLYTVVTPEDNSVAKRLSTSRII